MSADPLPRQRTGGPASTTAANPSQPESEVAQLSTQSGRHFTDFPGLSSRLFLRVLDALEGPSRP